MSEPLGTGFLHRGSGTHGFAVTHGAGSNCNAPLLVSLADALSDGGITVLRYDLPFRINHAGAPRAGDAALDREGIAAAVRLLRKVVSGRMVAGGHSYGGRQTSMKAAEDPSLADGLVFLSYPLHPPRRPADLRTAHFVNIRQPCLFVQGARDPFGSPQEMAEAVQAISGPTEFFLVERAGHDLTRLAGSMRSIAEKVMKWISTLP